ncbi:hypothetical protein ACHAP8_012460, partial [Fusarium lateritium]
MRLLNTTTFELQQGELSFFKQEGYAIFSHRWVGLEITFSQISTFAQELRGNERPLRTPQLDKIRGVCDVARHKGFKWIWIDNCCIDKSSTMEETESINSMFKWYQKASICITYLCDVRKSATCESSGELNADISNVFQSINGQDPSVWFTRGWTLQELLAPYDMEFYDMDWKFLGTKTGLAEQIEKVTKIETQYLTCKDKFKDACIAKKMSWMAGRETGKIEDIAYSMVGIFNVTLTPAYGEGLRAFMRLQYELLSSSPDESLFAWQMPHPDAEKIFNPGDSWGPDEWGLLAPSPDWFQCGSQVNLFPKNEQPGPNIGSKRTQDGVEIQRPMRRVVTDTFGVFLISTV